MVNRISKEKRTKALNKAVALTYEPELATAPRILAKGQGKTAEKIIEIAESNGIHIHRDPDMIEILSQLDLDEEIPVDLYQVIAELLAFVYELNRKK